MNFGTAPDPGALDHGKRLRELVEDFERAVIVTALVATGGNQRRAADILQVRATTLFHKIRRLGIRESMAPETPDELQRSQTARSAERTR